MRTPVLLVLLAFALSGSAQDPLRAFAPELAAALGEVHVPGMVIGLVQGDSTWILPVGSRDPACVLPTDAHTPYYIASVTKVFTAQAVLQLVQEGRITLDEPVRHYLPRFRLTDPGMSDSITVRDLLCHGKGLESWPITFGEAFTGQMDDERYYRLLARVEARKSFGYSNLHYTLLGRVIEAVTGVSWQEHLQQAVFDPADMRATSTSSETLARSDAAIPTAYVAGSISAADDRKTDRTMHAAGGMVTTAEDLLRWLRVQINDGSDGHAQIIPEGVVRGMRTEQVHIPNAHPFIAEQRRTGWGLGWMIREHRGLRYIVHNGGFDGWAAHLSYLPEHRMGLVILVNNKSAGLWLTEVAAVHVYERLLGMEVRDYLTNIPEKLRAPASTTSTDQTPGTGATGPQGLPWSAFAGTYVNPDWGMLEVATARGSITMHVGDLPLPLAWKDATTFIAGGDHEGSFVITEGKVTAVDLGMSLPDRARFERVP